MPQVESATPASLTCPECRSPFAVTHGTAGDGVAECACRQVVMVGGVVWPAGPDLVAAALAGRDVRRELLGRSWPRVRLLELAGRRLTFRRFLRHAVLGRLMRRGPTGAFFRRFAGHPVVRPFWGAGQWHLYMRHRFTTPSFMAARGALGLVEGRTGLVLDAPCGMGHLAHGLGRLVDPSRIVALDVDAPSAYATRRFFVPGAGAVAVWDLNRPLPLADGSVGAAFCVDAFHYVESKQELAAEFVRVLQPDGVLAILHLHNRLQENPTPGTPLAPSEYRALFPGCAVRMYPEADLLHASLHDEPLDLTRSASAERLDAAAAIVMVVARHDGALTRLDPVGRLLAERATSPRLAELYDVRDVSGDVVLEQAIPPTLLGEYPEMAEILPRRLEGAATATGAGVLTFTDPPDLLRRGVLLDLPENY